MERTPVKSSQIVSIGHDSEKNVLEIEFKGGNIYHYTDVDASKHAALIAAESIGKHFHANIRGQHQYHKLEAK